MKLILGNSLEKLKELEDNSIDSIVTDPPYHLVSIVKRFGKKGSAPAQYGKDGSFGRLSKGFMGKEWDGVDENGIGIAYNIDLWVECLRVLKPGGHLLAFSGTRTYHRMAVAIEDAGFEVRDMIEWVYGSGFPKSLNIGKAVDKLQGNEREVVGTDVSGSKRNCMAGDFVGGEYDLTKGNSPYEGWGTALKPSHEPICMARKPLAEKNVANNVLKWGTGGINIDESRVEEGGRFPANLIHDNSDEVRECFPETKSTPSPGHFRKGNVVGDNRTSKAAGQFGDGNWIEGSKHNDSGSASRFFKSIIYNPKASKAERNKGLGVVEDGNKRPQGEAFRDGSAITEHSERKGNNHPTVKPIALMEYLIKMVTPKGGTVLDPFMGSGSTGVAAKKNGYDFIGIDMTPEYIEIAKARINATEIENRLL
jgi:site-specific DNA-methyltransferase (adenine-specific)